MEKQFTNLADPIRLVGPAALLACGPTILPPGLNMMDIVFSTLGLDMKDMGYTMLGLDMIDNRYSTLGLDMMVIGYSIGCGWI